MYVEECANMHICLCVHVHVYVQIHESIVIPKIYKLLVISVRNK